MTTAHEAPATTADRVSTAAMVARQYDYYLTLFRRTWRGSVFSFGALPVLFLLSMGLGLGSYVGTGAQAGLGGISYLDFIAPGMLATNAMTGAVGESTWPVFGNFKWTKVYFSMTSTPLRIVDVLNGALVYVTARMALVCGLLVVVLACFGTVSSVLGGVLAVLVGTLVAMAHATPTFAYSAHLLSDSGFALLFRLGIIPMSLFSGAFFPVDRLPGAIEWLAYVTPIWHGVELTRMCTTGDWRAAAAAVHVLYLAVLVVLGWFLARRAFRDRLRDG